MIILFQSCAAGFVNSVNNSSDVGGSAGLMVCFIVIIASIIAIVARKSGKGSVVAGCFYGVAGLLGISNAAVYKDLEIWGVIYAIYAVYYIISGIRQIKKS